MKRLLLTAALLLTARVASAQLGTVVYVGPYQPSIFTPRMTYYNPSAVFYGVPDYYYAPPIYYQPIDPWYGYGGYGGGRRHRGW